MDFTELYEDSCSTVGLAARIGDVNVLKKLLLKGQDYCIKDNRGWFPIHEAAFRGHTDCVRELLNAACSNDEDPLEIWPPPYDISDGNAFVLAARGGHLDTVKVLVNVYFSDKDFQFAIEASLPHPHILSFILGKYTGSINYRNEWKSTFLHKAIEKSPLKSVEILLSQGINIEAKDYMGRTALHCVCGENRKDLLEIVKLLVQNGSDVNSCDKDGCSVLFVAVQNNHLHTVNYLLQCNADQYLCFPIQIIDQSSESESIFAAPICIAAEKGYLSILKLLIKGSNRNTFCKKNILSPVISAISGMQHDCLLYLLNCGYTLGDDCPLNDALLYLPFIGSIADRKLQDNEKQMLAFLLANGVHVRPLLTHFCCKEKLNSTINHEIFCWALSYGMGELLLSESLNSVSKLQHLISTSLSGPEVNSQTVSLSSTSNICSLIEWLPVAKISYDPQTRIVKKICKHIPSLKCFSRYYIRLAMVSRFGCVGYSALDKLPLPMNLKNYLWLDP